MSRLARHPRSTTGFTLLELVIVLALVALATSLVLPAVHRGLEYWRLQGATRDVATLFKFTRNRSVAGKEPLQVILDRSRSIYWLDNADASVLDDPPERGARGIRLYGLPKGIRFGEVIGAGANPDGTRVGVQFFPRGSSTGGQVQVLDERGRGYRITIDPVTGRTSIGG